MESLRSDVGDAGGCGDGRLCDSAANRVSLFWGDFRDVRLHTYHIARKRPKRARAPNCLGSVQGKTRDENDRAHRRGVLFLSRPVAPVPRDSSCTFRRLGCVLGRFRCTWSRFERTFMPFIGAFLNALFDGKGRWV